MQTRNASNVSENLLLEHFKNLVERMGSTDPRVKLMLEYYMQTRNASNVSENLHMLEGKRKHKDDLKTREPEREHKLILVDERDLNILIERNNKFASASGRCPYCWGKGCEKCKGEGTSTRLLNIRYFTELVVPTLNLLSKEDLIELVVPTLNQLGIVCKEESKEANKN
jgi:hypothetical protein